MENIARSYRFANLLSIDVAFGAVCSSLFFSSFLKHQASLVSLILLGIVVWIIYTTDHLYDAWKIKGKAKTIRHRFHQEKFVLLLILVIMAGMLAIMLLPFLSFKVTIAGLALALLVGVNLLWQVKIPGLKEFMIALLYCAGVMVPIIDRMEFRPDNFILPLQFFTVALTNLILFSWYEFKSDQLHRSTSVAITLGKKFCVYAISVLLCINLACLIISGAGTPSIIICIMGIGHVFLLCFEPYFRTNERYRLVGDALFFLPLINIWIG